MKIRLLQISKIYTLILLSCLAVISFDAIKSRLKDHAAARAQSVETWRELIANRKPTIGSGRGLVAIIEFSDYQCPFCKAMEPSLQQFINKHPGSIDLYRYDFPLESIHSFARAAANAADCAAHQGVTEAYQSQLFKQKTFEGYDWYGLARATGVPDLIAYRTCLDGDQSADAIKHDVETGTRLKVDSTPTFIIDGTMVRGAMSVDQLNAAYTDALKRHPH